jgi:DNA polymerase-3 subunit gamma/tau
VVGAEEDALALLAEAGDGSMRDALSIMDQAIASAPVEAGRAVLSAAQIRELMGSVPNAVFERLLEAVAAGQSAELMEQLNLLVNAGHSPSSLARQLVRYLRNALMSKLGGEQTELLQISGDERARAARTALLFSEEELTRNLQIVLRTFDDLNYRQEQRFHLELGLLKLIHAQRLLPLEELLSGVTGTAAPRGGQAPATSRPSVPTSRASAPSTPAASIPASKPTLSPFGSGGSWGNQPSTKQSASAVVEPVAETVSAPVLAAPAATPFPVASSLNAGVGFAETITEGALAKVPQNGVNPSDLSTPVAATAEAARTAVCAALATAGLHSASVLLGAGVWAFDGASLRIEVTGMGKKMISLTVNAAAEKIIRQELQRLGASLRFLVVPGEGNGGAGAAQPAPILGAVQEDALKHPLVQKAKEIFNAEVRSVVDLRVK